jgi:hypothetical protein
VSESLDRRLNAFLQDQEDNPIRERLDAISVSVRNVQDGLMAHIADCTKYRADTLNHLESVDDRVVQLEGHKRRSTTADAARLRAEYEASKDIPSVPPPRPKFDSLHDDSEETARKAGIAVSASPKVDASPEEIANIVKPLVEAASREMKAEAQRKSDEAFQASELARLKAIDDATADAKRKAKIAEDLVEATTAAAKLKMKLAIRYGAIAAFFVAFGTGAGTYVWSIAKGHELGVIEERANSSRQLEVMARSVDVAASAVAAVTAEPPQAPAPPAAVPAHRAAK